MKPLPFKKFAISFSPSERLLMKHVFLISLSLCLVSLAAVWVMQRGLAAKAEKLVKSNVSALLGKSPENLLPVDIEAHRVAAERFKHNDPNRSIDHLLRILAMDKKDRSIRLELGTLYLESAQYADAEKIFAELDDEGLSDSLTERIMARYGLTLFFTRGIEASSAQLERTIALYPSSPEAWCYRGQIAGSQNRDSPVAESFFHKALANDSSYAEAWYQYARFVMNKPHADSIGYNTARECLLKLITLEPLNPKAHSRLGMVYFYLRQPFLAEKSYQTALTLNATDYNTWYNLGELYYSQLDLPKKAAESMKKVLSIKPDHGEANFKLGLISLENHMYKEAVQYLVPASHTVQQPTRVLLQLGVAYEKLEMNDEAVRTYKTILEIDALNDVALQKLKLLGSGN